MSFAFSVVALPVSESALRQPAAPQLTPRRYMHTERSRVQTKRSKLSFSISAVQTSARDTPTPGYELVKPDTPLKSEGPLSQSQIDEFFETGVVIVRGLIAGSLLDKVQESRRELETGFGTVASEYEALSFRVLDMSPAFLELATNSPLTVAVAQLTPRDPDCMVGRELVVLKDALFTLKGEQKGCNFHVDDPFFWPTPHGEPGPGVNVWLALDKVDEDGGGLAVAPGSHTADYLSCREAIKQSTCNIHINAPGESQRLEAIRLAPQLEPGDAILMTRYLFHRANPFLPGSAGARGPGVTRYSVRYMPGNAWVHGIEVRRTENGMEMERLEPCQLMNADPERHPAAVAG